MNKELINAMGNFKNSAIELNTILELTSITAEEEYPFDNSFNEVVHKIIEWTDKIYKK